MTRESSESQRRRKPRRRYATPKQGGSVMPWIFGGGVIALCAIAFVMPREAQKPGGDLGDGPKAAGQGKPAKPIIPEQSEPKARPDASGQAHADPPQPTSGAKKSSFIETILDAESNEKTREALVKSVAQEAMQKTVRRAVDEGYPPFSDAQLDKIAESSRGFAKACVEAMIVIAKSGRTNGLSDESTAEVIGLIDSGDIPIVADTKMRDHFIGTFILRQKRIEEGRAAAKKAMERAQGGK